MSPLREYKGDIDTDYEPYEEKEKVELCECCNNEPKKEGLDICETCEDYLSIVYDMPLHIQNYFVDQKRMEEF